MAFRFGQAGILAAALAAAGCQTASLEDAAPRAALQPAAPAEKAEPAAGSGGLADEIRFVSPVPLPDNSGPPPPRQDFVGQGIDDSGEFPNVGVPRETANHQITAAEKAAMEAEIARLKAAQSADPSAQARYQARLAELRRLAETHAQEVEREIAK